jgi:transposase
MTKIKLTKVIDQARKSFDEDEDASPAFKKSFSDLLDVVSFLSNRLGMNSGNSSKPPSQDPNRKRSGKTAKGRKRKPGGQKGHKGNCLKPVEKPTESEDIWIDQRTLPRGQYVHVGFEARQVFDFEISLSIKEYRAEILENQNGQQYVADFPDGVTEPAQYGSTIKAHSVYMSQFQLVPLARVEDHFRDQLGLPPSKGSISNWNVLAYQKLTSFEEWARRALIGAICNNADETGINVGGKRLWLHSVSNEKVTLFHADEKRGQEAMDRMGVLPYFRGVLMHDHWKPYFGYACIHALCNAHHLRELEASVEFDNQKWAKKMQKLLIAMRDAVDQSSGVISERRAKRFKKAYRKLLVLADRECPRDTGSRAQTKSRNLLERLKDFEKETLRFLEDPTVPFTNNRGENDIRMTKVQQKISGCFRSMEGARVFCRVRSYLSTCRKNGVGPSEALRLLFDGKSPSFMK